MRRSDGARVRSFLIEFERMIMGADNASARMGVWLARNTGGIHWGFVGFEESEKQEHAVHGQDASGIESFSRSIYDSGDIIMPRLFFKLVNEDSGYEAILFVLSKCQRKHAADMDAKILIGFV